MPSNNSNLDKIAPSYMDGSNMNNYINNVAWNRENDDLFSSFFNPGSQQMEEYAQQLQLLGLEQDYAVKGKFQDMKDIGINPNLAAAGIAGSSGLPSAPAPNTSVGSGAQSVGAAGQAIGNIGAAVESISHANERNVLLDYNREQLRTQSIKNLEDAGLSHWNAVSVAEMLPLLKREKYAEGMVKIAQYRKTNQEYRNLKVEHDNIIAELDRIIAQKDLAISQQDYYKALADKTAEEARWQTAQNDFFERHHYSSSDPLDVSLRNSMVDGIDDVDKIGLAIEDSRYRSSLGQFSAEAEKAYEIELNRTKGKEEGEKEYRENRQWFKEHEAQVKAYWDFMYKIPSSIREYLLKGTMKRFNLDGVWFNGNGGAPPIPTQLSK